MLARSGGVRWDGRTLGPWAAALNGADALINLAGRSVDCRYTADNRREIMDSRLESTAVLREAILQADVPPRVWLQSSTATIYADTYGPPNAEDGVLGADGHAGHVALLVSTSRGAGRRPPRTRRCGPC